MLQDVIMLISVNATVSGFRLLAGMRNRVILAVRGGFLKERQEPAVTSAL